MTDLTTRDLIQRLADDLELWLDYCGPPSLPQEEDESFLLLNEARAYLAQPEPEGPTDEQICKVLHQAICDYPPSHPDALALDFRQYEIALEIRKSRAVLARWGHHS